MRRLVLLLAVGLTLIGVADTAAARSGSAATTITTHPQNPTSPHSRGAMSGAPSAPPSTIAAPDGYRTVVDDTGVVSVAIPVEWIAETTPGVRWTPDGEQFAPWIIAARDAAASDCDGCDAFFHAPDLHISVSPYEPVSPEAPEDCDAVDVIPFDSHGFTGRREIGGGCDADIERIVASKPGAITVDIQLTYSTSDQGPLSEAERAAIADVFETALATFEWTGRPFEDVVPVGLPPVTTTQPTPTPPTLCVLADIDFAAVRSAPGTDNPEVGRIPPGTCGVVPVASDFSTGEEWLHVQYDGIDGWSAARLYVPDANAPSPTTAPGPVGADLVDVASVPATGFECPDPQRLAAALGLPVSIEDEPAVDCLYHVAVEGAENVLIELGFVEGTSLEAYAPNLIPGRADCPPFAPGPHGELEAYCSPVLTVYTSWPGGILGVFIPAPGLDEAWTRDAYAATLGVLGLGGVDLSNAEIPALCGFPAGQLVNGELRVEEVPPDSFMGARLASQVEGDVDGDGVPEVAAEFICSGGGDVFWQAVAVFRNDLTPIGAFDVEEMAIPGFDWTSAEIESLTWDAGRFRIDAAFSASASDSRSTSAWLSVVDGALQVATADPAADDPSIADQAADDPWPFEGDWLDAVPQLGTEPVRGSGCGADGSIGDVIPDGWWFGAVKSSDDTQIGFTIACAYYGESALPYLEECGEDCEWVESFMPRFYTDHVWLVPTDDGIVKELTAACADSAAALEAQFIGGLLLLSWIHVVDGRVDYVRYACPGG